MISAAAVKKLRERTGAGMMECKKALLEVGGDMELAIENLRKSGKAKADKKSNRVAADGRIVISSNKKYTVIIEVNSETDFVAKDENFIQFSKSVADTILISEVEQIQDLNLVLLDNGKTIEEARVELVSKVGENIFVRRYKKILNSQNMGIYIHGSRIGAVVAASGDDLNLSHDIAMHIAASNPICIQQSDVPANLLEREQRIIIKQSERSGKSPEIVKKMVQGRITKFLNEITLMGQPFVKDPVISVGEILKNANVIVSKFIRYEVGEGIEKKENNFAKEVINQITENKK
tara:strand:- start:53 stop:928 length:876 start_codon:yes stop_codon:yes gene_type:complete